MGDNNVWEMEINGKRREKLFFNDESARDLWTLQK
jgi:hypothetical protein